MLRAREVDVRGNLGAIVTITGRGPQDGLRLVDVGSFPGGRSLVAYNGFWDDETPVYGRILSHDTVGPVLQLSTRQRHQVVTSWPSVAMHGSRATVIWTYGIETDDKGRSGLRSRAVTADGHLGPVTTIFTARPGTVFWQTNLSGNATGRLVVTWRALVQGKPGTQVFAAASRP
jgi:hypothetical protein